MVKYKQNNNKTTMVKCMSTLLALVLLLALPACGKKDGGAAEETVTLPVSDGATVGSGATTLAIQVRSADGKEISFTVNTDETTLGAALQKLGIIAGDSSDYGLYVKSVNGETADYEADGTFWSVYIDNEAAPVGVDSIAAESGKIYAFRVEKAA